LKLALTRRFLARVARKVTPAFEVSPFHKLIIEHLELLLSSKIKKLAIITPPCHGQTTLGNVIKWMTSLNL